MKIYHILLSIKLPNFKEIAIKKDGFKKKIVSEHKQQKEQNNYSNRCKNNNLFLAQK